MKRAQSQILLHGIIVLLAGMLSGIPYGLAITRGWGEEAVRAWRLAHLSFIVGAVLLLAVAGVSHLLVLNARAVRAFVWTLVGSVYLLTVALVVAAVGGVRGLDPVGPSVNLVVFFANMAGALGAGIGVILMAIGALAALRNSAHPEP